MAKNTTLHISVFIFLVLFSLNVTAQVTGSIKDSAGHNVQFCNVLLIKAADSNIVTSTTTDTSGMFQLKTNATDNFRLLAYFIGFRKQYSPVFTIKSAEQTYDAGTITLHSDARVLNSVTISAAKPFMEQKLDRTVFNVESNVIFEGDNALEILAKLPGVSVDNNDNIKVAGNTGIMVMIDGKTSYMSSSDLAQYLKSLDSHQVEKIEVITNPSSKYDAAGSAIINIVLKKDKNMGFNGQLYFNYNQGVSWRSYDGLNFNYRTKKWNFYGNVGGGYFNNVWWDELQKTYLATSSTPQQTFTGDNSHHNQILHYFGKGGIDFTPTDKQTISLQAMSGSGSVTGGNHVNTTITGTGGETDSLYSVSANATNGWTFSSYSLNYDNKMDTNGREFVANVEYNVFTNYYNEDDVNAYYNSTGQTLRPSSELYYAQPVYGNVFAGKVDYTYPLGQKNRIDIGAKASMAETDNNSQYWNIINGGEIPDSTKTNHFNYKERIMAAYLNYYHKFNDKWEAQVGLRAEQTNLTGTQIVHDTTFSRSYLDVFPTAFVTWKPNANNSFNLSYSRRIDRPDYDALNPFLKYVDPYNYYSGNINLLPEYADNFEIKYMYKTWLNTGYRYSYYVNIFEQTYSVDPVTRITYNMPANLGYFDEMDLYQVVTIPLTKWFTTITSNHVYYNHYTGIVSEGHYSNSGFVWIPGSMNTFNLKRGWSANFEVLYNSRNLNGVGVTEPFWVLSAGIKKSFAGNRATVTVNCNDLLWTDRIKTTYNYPGLNVYSSFYNDSRRVRVSFTWSFGRSQYQRENKENAASEEQNRIKSGN